MGQEIRATGYLSITKNGLTATGNTAQIISLSGSTYFSNVQTVGTSYEALSTGDLSDIRYLFLSNISTASIEMSQHADSASFACLRPNDVVMLTPSGSFMTYQVKSTMNNADVQVVMTEA